MGNDPPGVLKLECACLIDCWWQIRVSCWNLFLSRPLIASLNQTGHSLQIIRWQLSAIFRNLNKPIFTAFWATFEVLTSRV